MPSMLNFLTSQTILSNYGRYVTVWQANEWFLTRSANAAQTQVGKVHADPFYSELGSGCYF